MISECRAQGLVYVTGKVPDIVLENFDGPRSFTIIDVKTFDPAGPTHIATNHTDRTRLAAHAAVARRCRDTEYGPLPERMRLIVLPISIFLRRRWLISQVRPLSVC